MPSVIERLVWFTMRRSLQHTFHQVVWMGPIPSLPPEVPVIAYANHHYFYDGYLMWLLLNHWLGRRAVTWMAEWDRTPFFAAAGAYPFPHDQPQRRTTTIRQTIRLFREENHAALAYFPEGNLQPREHGIREFDVEPLQRLDKLLPSKVWWPVAIYITWRSASRPYALLGGGTMHTHADGRERDRIERVWQRLQTSEPKDGMVLLEGTGTKHESWDLSYLAPLFRSRI